MESSHPLSANKNRYVACFDIRGYKNSLSRAAFFYLLMFVI